jgi:tRNA-dihydrouridine synthase A
MMISIAPMVGLTNEYFRYLIRLMSRQVLLYTEMITTPALLRGNKGSSLLRFSEKEHPLSIQLAGKESKDLAYCARLAEGEGYDEINLNAGCPSARMQASEFGIYLMQLPERVAECVDAMKNAVNVPITVKMRLSSDDHFDQEALYHFINIVSEAGCQTFIIHARGVILKKLSTRANRSRLPLMYEPVYQLQRDFPHLSIVLNGGIRNFEQAEHHLKAAAGVMMGRAAYRNPYMFLECDSRFYHKERVMRSREEIAEAYMQLISQPQHRHMPLVVKIKPLMNLYHGQPNASFWRKEILKKAELLS